MSYSLIVTGVSLLLVLIVIFLARSNMKKAQEVKAEKVKTAKEELKKERVKDVLATDKIVEEKINEEFDKIEAMDDDDLLTAANGVHRRSGGS